jgi:hypothetical protein
MIEVVALSPAQGYLNLANTVKIYNNKVFTNGTVS